MAFQNYKHANNFHAQIDGALGSGATALTLKNIVGDQPEAVPYIATLVKYDPLTTVTAHNGLQTYDEVQSERVTVTAHGSWPSVTIARSFDGDTALDFDDDDYVELRVDHKIIDDLQDHATNLKLNKLDGTTAPAVGDDSGDGYAVGSVWIDVTNDKAYVAVDVSVGAAVWRSIANFEDGWVPASYTYVYVSALVIKITGVDVTSKFPKGTRIKLTQATGGTKYWTVGSSTFSTDTSINLVSTTDYTLVNEAITAPHYSYAENPIGFPTFFNATAPTWNVTYFDNGAGGQPTTVTFKYRITGATCYAFWSGSGVKATTNNFTNISSWVIPAFLSPNIAGPAWINAGSGDKISVILTSTGTNLYPIFNDNIADNATITGHSFSIVYNF